VDFYRNVSEGGNFPIITQDQSGCSRKISFKLGTEAGSLACVARNGNIQSREALLQE